MSPRHDVRTVAETPLSSVLCVHERVGRYGMLERQPDALEEEVGRRGRQAPLIREDDDGETLEPY